MRPCHRSPDVVLHGVRHVLHGVRGLRAVSGRGRPLRRDVVRGDAADARDGRALGARRAGRAAHPARHAQERRAAGDRARRSASALALLASGALQPVLYHVNPRDAAVFAGVVATLALASLRRELPAGTARHEDRSGGRAGERVALFPLPFSLFPFPFHNPLMYFTVSGSNPRCSYTARAWWFPTEHIERQRAIAALACPRLRRANQRAAGAVAFGGAGDSQDADVAVPFEREVVAELLEQDEAQTLVSRLDDQQPRSVVCRFEEVAQRARFPFDDLLRRPPLRRTEGGQPRCRSPARMSGPRRVRP